MVTSDTESGDDREPRPTEMDAALLRRIRAALTPYDPDSYTLEHAWQDPPAWWFVEVSPSRADAAAFSAAFDSWDLVSISIGKNTWFEVYGVKDEDDLAYIEQLASAVFGGDLEEVPGNPKDVGAGFARITLADGSVVSAGAAHLPVPWKWHEHIHYVPYAETR